VKGRLVLRKIQLVLFLLVLTVILCNISCETKQAKKNRSGENDTLAQNQSTKPKESQETTTKYGLNWGNFSQHPAKMKIENSFLLNELTVLILYYGLLGKPYEASEFASYFPEYQNAPNEFERRKVSQSLPKRLDEVNKTLLSITLCVKVDDLRIGEYDFDKRGFPFSDYYGETKETMTSYVLFEDHSKSGDDVLGVANMMGAQYGYAYSAVNSSINFDNIKDRNVFPSFVPVDESTAERIVSEFGRGENPTQRQIAEAMGQTYKGYRTTSAYVIFVPKAAKAVNDYIGDVNFHRKEVHGNGIYVVFATENGTVLGVYPKIQ
jgi:hypothetical protein